jgi:hypothetical protein
VLLDSQLSRYEIRWLEVAFYEFKIHRFIFDRMLTFENLVTGFKIKFNLFGKWRDLRFHIIEDIIDSKCN